MRIIKSGRKLEELSWVGSSVICAECTCKFILEDGDKVELIPEWFHDGDYYKLKCPDCKMEFHIRKRVFLHQQFV